MSFGINEGRGAHRRELTTDWSHIDLAFGHWLAGFVDGEGSFAISQPRRSYICTFCMSLRRDDLPILEECRDRLDLGYIILIEPRGKSVPRNAQPQARWEIGGKRPCYSLACFFDRFPLRAKKARDFAIWRKAAIEWNRMGPGKGAQGTDWSRMAELSVALKAVRLYREPSGLPPLVPAPVFEQAELTL